MTQRSLQQNKSIHLDCKLIADALNDAGLDMKVVLKPEIEIPWSQETVKKYLFKPIMKAHTTKESTTELEKTSGEIDRIHDILMRHLGTKFGIEYFDFPHDKEKENKKLKALDMARDMHSDQNYPDDYKKPLL